MQKNLIYYQHGERIIQAGNIEKKMFIIIEGSVEISLAEGINRVVVATLNKGDFFGEISLFANTPRSAHVTAMGNVKLVYIDSVEQLKNFLIKNPNFAAKMVQTLATRLAKTDEILIGKVSELNRLQLTREV
ncbi:MAG: cyclic nucleotide-binding domain-containing protein [Spirochaetes bacterium]|jgi:CRP-like cAMP-binding protein|nr:cyclic nucleotide-binding domain-containing protein [Spirochaetota bacterium]